MHSIEHKFEEQPYESGDKFDFTKHVTAGQLRLVGLALPKDVPACAWIPMGSFRVGEDGNMVFDEPFRWEQRVTERFIETPQ